MLACARIGAVHSVVFAGFSAESLASRVEDCKSRVVVTTSGVMRGKKKLETKAIVDDALQISKREGFEVSRQGDVLHVVRARVCVQHCIWVVITEGPRRA